LRVAAESSPTLDEHFLCDVEVLERYQLGQGAVFCFPNAIKGKQAKQTVPSLPL
jgi:hypothetical protein